MNYAAQNTETSPKPPARKSFSIKKKKNPRSPQIHGQFQQNSAETVRQKENSPPKN